MLNPVYVPTWYLVCISEQGRGCWDDIVAFQAGEDGLPRITKRARAGGCVEGGMRQRLSTAVSRTGRRCTSKRQSSQLG